MLKEEKIPPSQGQAGSPIPFIPKSNGWCLCQCVDYRRHNDIKIKGKTALCFKDE
jgi:hypothetical protein